MEAPHDFVDEFVDLPPHSADMEYLNYSVKSENGQSNMQELFYSPMLSVGPGSTEITPFMGATDQGLVSDFAIPPSYFSPSISPALHPSEVPDFELPKKVGGIQAGRVRKPSHQRSRQKFQNSLSRRDSTNSSIQSRYNSSASPQNATPEEDQLELGAPAVTPATLMNVSLNPQEQQYGIEERLDRALASQSHTDTAESTQTPSRRFSGASQSSQSSAVTPAIRPRRSAQHSHSASSSPALGPYISPTIAADSDMISMLASKSNYQNIVDGKHQQLGLQYPERLTSDVANKKTSHKIAEQERRNRINVAIAELGKLVTPDTPMTSKAATVEVAIAHIKELHEQIGALKKRLGET